MGLPSLHLRRPWDGVAFLLAGIRRRRPRGAACDANRLCSGLGFTTNTHKPSSWGSCIRTRLVTDPAHHSPEFVKEPLEWVFDLPRHQFAFAPCRSME